ncbi:MAG: Lsm family RNA-binding protein [Promethearchaeota archaeon]
MSIASNAAREFNKEISQALNSMVKVVLDKDQYYTGRLVGFELNSLSLCLANAINEKKQKTEKIFIRGGIWQTISIEGEPFPMDKLVERLRKILPDESIEYHEDAIRLLGGKIIITESGVEGRGPTHERIKRLYDNFCAELDLK